MISAAIYGGLAFGTQKRSRICGVLMLVLYVISSIIMMVSAGPSGMGGIFIKIFIIFIMGKGVLALFKYHQPGAQTSV